MEINSHVDVPRDPKELVELLAIVHLGIATNEDGRISSGSAAPYRHSERALKAMLLLAYPELSEDRIYEIWLDCNESIAYCAKKVEKEVAFEREQERLDALQDAAWAAGEARGKEDARNLELNGVEIDQIHVPDAFFKEARDDYVQGHNFGMRLFYKERTH